MWNQCGISVGSVAWDQCMISVGSVVWDQCDDIGVGSVLEGHQYGASTDSFSMYGVINMESLWWVVGGC